MEIYGLQKLTLLDFPGRTACIVFTGGCNFRCPFCYNGLLVKKNTPVIPEEEFFDYLSQRKKLLDGVSVSGGEPTLNCDLDVFIKKIKELGFQVKLDTNGSSPKTIDKLIKENLLDYVAVDIKNSPEKYDLTTASHVDLSKIKETVDLIKKSGVEYELRTTVSRELHEKQDFCSIGKWLGKGGTYYLQAVSDTGDLLSDKAFHAPDKETLTEYAEILRSFGIDARVRNE